jgi:hypothetical protein
MQNMFRARSFSARSLSFRSPPIFPPEPRNMESPFNPVNYRNMLLKTS